MKYPFSVDMFHINEDGVAEFIESVNAYTSKLRAERACDRLNAYDDVHPVYGEVWYEVGENA